MRLSTATNGLQSLAAITSESPAVDARVELKSMFCPFQVISFLITAFAPGGPSQDQAQAAAHNEGHYIGAVTTQPHDDRTDQLCPEQLSFRPAH